MAKNLPHDMQEAEELISTGLAIKDIGSAAVASRDIEQAPPQYDESGEASLVLYSKVYQSNPIHAFISSGQRDITIDPVTHGITIESDGVKIKMKPSPDGKPLTKQAAKVLIILLLKVTGQLQYGDDISAHVIDRGRKVEITVAEYMEMCNINDVKEARAQLNDAISALQFVSFEWDEVEWKTPEGKSRRVKEYNHHTLNLTDETITPKGTKKSKHVTRGVATFVFGFNMAKYLSNAYVMPFALRLLSINTKRHPHSVPIGWKLCLQHNLNFANDKRRYTETVKTLLDAAKDIPRYSDMAAKGKIYDRIIKPFDRDFAELVRIGVLSEFWYFDDDGNRIDSDFLIEAGLLEPTYTDEQGERIHRTTVATLSYSDFSALHVHYAMKDYPDQTPRIEAEQKRIKNAIRRKQIAAKKKTEEADKVKPSEAGAAGDGAQS